MVGLYKINESDALFEALNSNIIIKHKTQDEYHLTDGIMRMIGSGIKFNSFPVENWYDCGKRDVLLETNATMLKREGFQVADPEKYENTILVQPVAIAQGVKIKNSIIGPNVTIGEKTKIAGSIIRDSIIGNYSRLGNVVLHNSVIGSDTSIKGLRHSLNIGDNTEIDLS
ncbi:MAG: glucose-1-phosphate thymidylyltransferase [Limisphaerales bacterium]